MILFIGDGMGPTHREAARLLKVGFNGLLAMEDMPVAGMAKTHSAKTPATDSAAAATALATGVKTYDAGIGVDVRVHLRLHPGPVQRGEPGLNR
jgi:alkaline phosphatase